MRFSPSLMVACTIKSAVFICPPSFSTLSQIQTTRMRLLECHPATLVGELGGIQARRLADLFEILEFPVLLAPSYDRLGVLFFDLECGLQFFSGGCIDIDLAEILAQVFHQRRRKG